MNNRKSPYRLPSHLNHMANRLISHTDYMAKILGSGHQYPETWATSSTYWDTMKEIITIAWEVLDESQQIKPIKDGYGEGWAPWGNIPENNFNYLVPDEYFWGKEIAERKIRNLLQNPTNHIGP